MTAPFGLAVGVEDSRDPHASQYTNVSPGGASEITSFATTCGRSAVSVMIEPASPLSRTAPRREDKLRR